MILRACTVCGRLRCEEHRPAPRPSAHEQGYNARWRRASAVFLQEHPYCECGPECCPQGCALPSAHVDHVDGLGPLGPRGFDEGNFRALAHRCHSRKTARAHGLGGAR